MRKRTELSNRDRLIIALFGLPFLLSGLFAIAVGLHWISFHSMKMHSPGWVIALVGLPGLCAGIVILDFARSGRAPSAAIMGAVMFVAITIVVHWVAFGPGPREFSYKRVSNNVVVESGPLDEASGRRMSAGAAIMLDLIFLAWAAWWVSNRGGPRSESNRATKGAPTNSNRVAPPEEARE
jgi:hypothetical protein